jgi:hypothetical protein
VPEAVANRYRAQVAGAVMHVKTWAGDEWEGHSICAALAECRVCGYTNCERPLATGQPASPRAPPQMDLEFDSCWFFESA